MHRSSPWKCLQAPVVERGEVSRAKPAPDLFLACQQRLGVSAQDCYVVGDAVWDLLAAAPRRHADVGVLSGGLWGGRADSRRARTGSTGTPRSWISWLDELGVLD